MLAIVGAAALAMITSSSAAAQKVPDVDPAAIQVPDLTFTPTPEIADNFDKYYYFTRADTDFATAYADLRECDGYARGLSYFAGGVSVPYPYGGTLGGAIGGAIGSAIADAIYGSAARRQQRRDTMRKCMGYKEYQRYGLPKDIWKTFNFEEGNGTVDEAPRQIMLQQQAKIASGAKPTQPALEL